MLFRSALINVLVRAVERAGVGLRRDFGEAPVSDFSRKGVADFVTSTDLRIERRLVQDLSQARPEFGILSEEMGYRAASESGIGDGERLRFVIDPLDGTLNFMHGVSSFCISVAVEEEVGGRVLAGVIHDPILHETFWGERGVGAFLGDRRLSVRSPRSFRMSLLSTTLSFCKTSSDEDAHRRFMGQFSEVVGKSGGVRLRGSAALDLAYLAAGRLDGFWSLGLSHWDVAAGILLVEMAGGVVTDLGGKDKGLVPGEVLAASRGIFQSFRDCLSGGSGSGGSFDHIGPAIGGIALGTAHDSSHSIGDG